MRTVLTAFGVVTLVICAVLGVPTQAQTPASSSVTAASGAVRAIVDVRIPALNGSPAIPAATVSLREGRIESVRATTAADRRLPDVVSYTGATLLPGLVAAHVHISDINGLEPRAYTAENTERQLALFARYGITTVFSLGGEQAPAFSAREAQSVVGLSRARLWVAGQVITGATPEAARANVARVAATKPDIIKIRVDDNLGASQKMAPEVYRAVIDEAHARGLRVAAHLFYLDDAKGLLKAGVDFIAHSVRDLDIDDEFIALMKARNVPYCPTLTRELAAFVYETAPPFFSDPFFTREASAALVTQLQDPARQQNLRNSASAQRYKQALVVAKRNLKKASDAGLNIVMGTDSGAFPERFEGYFEHLEMEMMADSGMTPTQVIDASTVNAARAMKLDDVGILKAGARADFVILNGDPTTDIRNTRNLRDVWIDGRRLAR